MKNGNNGRTRAQRPSLRWLVLMAWRDSRRNRARMLLFMSSIVAGIAALVAIYSFGDDLRRNIDEQAASLIGADLSVSGRWLSSADAQPFLDSLGKVRSTEENLVSMAYFPVSGGTRLVQVRALEGDYPYYGDLETVPVSAAKTFRGGQSALVDETLMLQFNTHVGDTVRIGNLGFRVAGILDKAPGSTNFFASMAPVVYIPRRYLQATGLMSRGSRSGITVYYKYPVGTDVQKIMDAHQAVVDDKDLHYETVETRKENTGRVFSDMTRFLSIVGFIALLLGCVGVASAIHVYIREKIGTIAILRCLGTDSVSAFMIYLIQITGIGLAGSILGVILGTGVQRLLPLVLADFLPIEVHSAFSWAAMAQGLILGVVISLVFGLLPLLSIRKISPLFTLRVSFESVNRKDPWRWGVYALILLFIASFTEVQFRNWRPSLFFTIAVVVSFFLLSGVARLLMGTVRRYLRPAWGYLARQGFSNLYRPNNQTVILVVAIGLSTALISMLWQVQGILLKQITLSGSTGQANVILFDIQSSQEASLDSLTRRMGFPVMEKVPIVNMRIASLNGKTEDQVKDDSLHPRARRPFAEEVRASYRDSLRSTESVTAGKWVGTYKPSGSGQGGGGASSPVPVSLEEGYAHFIGAKVGDSLVFNVQGAPVPAIVGSTRKVSWNRLQTNFRVLFPDGVLESAPQFHVLLTRASSTAASVRYQQAVVRAFPNVSIIDLGLILSVLDDLLGKISDVIHFMAAFSIITGIIVLIASVRNSKYQRIQETVLLRTLGASRRQVLSISALEYIFLGALSAVTGIGIALVGSWLLASRLFHLPYSVNFIPEGVLFLSVTAMTLVIGLWNSRSVLNRPPLDVLRRDV